MTTPLSVLQKLFKPGSVALFGASESPGSLGTVLLQNMRNAGYAGDLVLVNPKYETIGEEKSWPSLAAAGRAVDLGVVVAPAAAVPDIITDCGGRGVPAVVVISAGFREAGPVGAALERDMLARARQHGIRILGPNCLGIIRADIGLNATFSAGNASRGRIAIASQSGALCTAILDWAAANDVGFSSLISTGIGADVGFGEVLDFLSLDPETDSIMLYIEGIRDARRFMSALRAAARTKPVVIMKGGRHAQGSAAAVSHTGALVGSDDAFDAAIRRAGALRVASFPDFFSAAATLDTGLRTNGPRLGVVTNAGGPGVMAADQAADYGFTLARLRDDTVTRLDGVLPSGWSRGNPIDVLGDATPERYGEALTACSADPDVDAILAILTPQALTAPLDVAERLVALKADTKKPLLACWMGEVSVATSRELFRRHDIPSYRTPEAAVDAFVALARYRDSQAQLLQVPDPLEPSAATEPDNARLIIENVLTAKRRVLNVAESKAVLGAFRLPVLASIPADTAEEAMLVAQELGYPVALKINSPDITHKSDVGGVRLGIANAREVREVFQELVASVRTLRPEATVDGVFVEPMWPGRSPRELMIGVVRDEVFGPVISCGLGGTMVEVLDDQAVALPPLNRFLVRDLIDRTRAARVLGELRGAPPANRRAVEDLLLRVSEMVCELPTLVEMDLNPVMVDEAGATIVDARIVVAPASGAARPYDHVAIHPYPRNLVQQVELTDGTDVTIRPIRPEDAAIERDFVEALSAQSRYFRFMYALPRLTPDLLSRFTQIDYDREMALIATVTEDGREREVGVTRYASALDPDTCEFAVVVADAWQNRGLARLLLTALVEAARYRQYRTMTGMVLAENHRMLEFARSLGFTSRPNPDDRELVDLELEL